ncbi:relaxase/mobilization nuclease domain-containing protein [uncultured Fibrella sp.]|uniref:relaxase/mobilization nuclease domain-containing protein n=1 Tax=uncultured Fibrella sp. TaxID=1284596 RepID=UPI0035CBB560
MVIRGNTRGNGAQLAAYLLGHEQNDRVHILEIDGRMNAKASYLQQTLQTMSMTAELTKSPKGLYHAQINPAYSEDRKMTTVDWLTAADILGKQLGLDGQRRVVVLHTKKNRTHAHVVFERYNHQTGKVISNSFSRLAQDRARKEMERVFEQAPTPHRNKHRPELKETLTKLWQDTTTAPDFIQAVHGQGYLLAEGVPRHPFMVVDEQGRSFDLVRQLNGVRIKEVRQRLRDATLIPEKRAIEIMRERQESNSDAANTPQQKADPISDRTTERVIDADDTPASQPQSKPMDRRHKLMADFIQMGQEQTAEPIQNDSLEKKKAVASAFLTMGDELTSKLNDTVAEEAAKLPTTHDTNSSDNTTPSIEAHSGQDERERDEEVTDDELETLPDTEAINHYRQTLTDFLNEKDDLLSPTDPAEINIQRQREKAKQFFDNQEAYATAPKEADSDLQRLIAEQKEVRERTRLRSRKRTR